MAAIQRVLEDPEIRIKRLYQVRWLSFDIAVDAVLRSLKSLMMFFEHAANEGDPTAVGIHSCIKFLALTHLIKDILSVLTKLSLTFQLQQVDISLVHSNVTAAIDALDNMISPNGEYILYNISDNNTQRSSFELARRNFIAKLKGNLSDRFVDSALIHVSAFKIFDPKYFPTTVSKAAMSNFGEEELKVIIKHYSKSSPDEHKPPLNDNELRSEYELFHPFVIHNFQKSGFYSFAITFLQIHSEMYPQISHLLSILVILPVSSVPCERGFSAANRIKTKLRNRLMVQSLDILLRISIEGPPIEQFDFTRGLALYKNIKSSCIDSSLLY